MLIKGNWSNSVKLLIDLSKWASVHQCLHKTRTGKSASIVKSAKIETWVLVNAKHKTRAGESASLAKVPKNQCNERDGLSEKRKKGNYFLS